MKRLDLSTETAARMFLNALRAAYPVIGGIVFGSRARGTFNAASDTDIAVLLAGDGQSTVSTMLDMIDAAYAVELESGIVISPLPIWQDQWEHPEHFSNPALLRNIQRDGIRL